MWRTTDWVRVVDPVAGDDTAADRNGVDTAAFSPDGGTLVMGGWTKGALLRRVGGSWDVIGERLPRDELSGTGTLAVWDDSPGNAVTVGPGSGGPVAAGGADGVITTGGLTLRHEPTGEHGDVSLRSLARSRDGRTLYSAADDGRPLRRPLPSCRPDSRRPEDTAGCADRPLQRAQPRLQPGRETVR
ncbi:hypothetical protein [Streptomyces mirabilis]|uniref:hypothetical protein n=1 Tax=Streptomyces mirabilis TaxID=68239 RepID=UPI00339F8331